MKTHGKARLTDALLDISYGETVMLSCYTCKADLGPVSDLEDVLAAWNKHVEEATKNE